MKSELIDRPLPVLSTEIWQKIFRYAHRIATEPQEQNEQANEYLRHCMQGVHRKSTVVSILQTCKSWYTMAAAIFYKDAAVRDLASFLRGFDSTADSRLPLPKASLLAQTRSLCVVQGQRFLGQHIDDMRKVQVLAADQVMRDEAYDLLSIIYRSTNPFPSLRHLQIGVPKYFARLDDPTEVFLKSRLLRTCQPQILCCYNSVPVAAYRPEIQPVAFLQGTLPVTVITHVSAGGEFDITWGTGNSVFLMERENNTWYDRDEGGWAQQHANWLCDILYVPPEWACGKGKTFEDVLRKTRIKVYGITDDYYNDGDDDDPVERISQQAMKDLEEKLWRMLQSWCGGSDEAWKACLELAFKDDRPHCPVCGLNVQFKSMTVP